MPRVLFVCTANICRSPMAARLFEHHLASRGELPAREWVIGSAGTWAADGLPASSGSVAALARRGIELAGHRSRSLEEADLRQADLVLVMTAGHREGILAEFPFAADRVYLISQMGGRTYDIADPYGGPQEGYDACADELNGLIEGNLERIIEVATGASPMDED